MATATARRTGKLQRSQRVFAACSLTPIMLYMMAFTLLPMIWAVIITFYRYSPTRQGANFLGLGGGNPFVGFANYLDLFADTPTGRLFRLAVKNTFVFALLVLPLNLCAPCRPHRICERAAQNRFPHHLLPADGDLSCGRVAGLGRDL